MSDCLFTNLKSYIYSDYAVDDRYQGFFTCDLHAYLGRATSCIDIHKLEKQSLERLQADAFL